MTAGSAAANPAGTSNVYGAPSATAAGAPAAVAAGASESCTVRATASQVGPIVSAAASPTAVHSTRTTHLADGRHRGRSCGPSPRSSPCRRPARTRPAEPSATGVTGGSAAAFGAELAPHPRGRDRRSAPGHRLARVDRHHTDRRGAVVSRRAGRTTRSRIASRPSACSTGNSARHEAGRSDERVRRARRRDPLTWRAVLAGPGAAMVVPARTAADERDGSEDRCRRAAHRSA